MHRCGRLRSGALIARLQQESNQTLKSTSVKSNEIFTQLTRYARNVPAMTRLPALQAILAPAHFFAYATLLGAQLYQSFVVVKIAYEALPAQAFTSLQKRVFPIYFRRQTALLILTAITFPHGPLALIKRKGDWVPFFVAGATALLNLAVYGPRTSRLMMRRRVLADQIDDNKELPGVNRAFSWNHAMSVHLNIGTIGATLWYGWRLASKLNFEHRRIYKVYKNNARRDLVYAQD
ncbi:hypothetical protein PMIN07_008082 [Paraphaeosphaeria minitans]